MAEGEEVKLLGMWVSPYGRRIEMALKLKGIPFEYVEEDLTNKSPLLLEMNPVHKKIPVLIHNGKPVAESLVILEYIDDTWSNRPLLPEDPHQRAMARFWAKFIDEKIVSILRKIVVEAEEEEEKEAAVEAMRELMKFLEKQLEGKDFFGGKTIGFLDIVATVIAFWVMRSDELLGFEMIPEENFPEIHGWVRKLSEIDVVMECIPPKDKYIEYAKVYRQKMKST